jgi:type II secretory pathway component PulF
MRIPNYILYVTVLLSYILTGLVISILPKYHKHVYDVGLPGKPLPAVTEWVLACSSFPGTLIVEAVIGVLFFGLFLFLDRGDARRRAYLPMCLTAALALNWFQLFVVFVAITLPLIPIIA